MSRVVPSGMWQVASFARCLSLRDLASLSCAQKGWQAFVILTLSSPRLRQLVQALEASLPDVRGPLAYKKLAIERPTASSFDALLRQLWTLVSDLQAPWNAPWGPAIAAAPGLYEDLTQLFSVPALPPVMKERFVTSMGLHITCQQLMVAAYKQVTRVEHWAHVQHVQGISSDLPEVFVSVCCIGKEPELEQLQSLTLQEKEDILQLAVNGDCSHTARCVAAALLPQVTDPAKLLHLLQTAVVRGHDRVVRSAAACKTAEQLPPAAILQLMQAADIAKAGSYGRAGAILQWLVQFPAASKIITSDIVPLIQQAVVSKCDTSVQLLCSLPAAHDTPAGDLVSMLHQTVGRSPATALRALCSLSAAAKLSYDDIMQLMSKATTVVGYDDVCFMCPLPAAQDVPFDFYSKMLDWAVSMYSDDTVASLCSLPAASKVDASTWVRYMTESLAQSSCYDRKAAILCSLPVVNKLSPNDFIPVLREAIQRQHWHTYEALCQTSVADRMPPGYLAVIVKQIWPKPVKPAYYGYGYNDNHQGEVEQWRKRLQLLASLACAKFMCAADLFALIRALVQMNCSDEEMLQLWFSRCFEAHSVSVEELAQQMLEAISEGNSVLLEALCQLPAATQMRSIDTLLQLIGSVTKASYKRNKSSMLQELSKLPAAVSLSSRELAGVLSAVVHQNIRLVPELCQVPAAALLPVATVADLLQTAVQRGAVVSVQLLCGMQVAALLSCDVIKELLLVAVDGVHDDDVTTELVEALCALPGATKVTNVGLLLTKVALAQSEVDPFVVEELCDLPGARSITADALADHLDAAVKTDSRRVVCSLCRLPGGSSIQQQGVLQLLQTAIQIGNPNGIPYLCRLRAAHRIPVESLLKLLKTLAPQHRQQDAMMALIQLLERVQRVRKYFTKYD